MGSELLTRVLCPGVPDGGFMDWGRHSRAAIIRRTKEIAEARIKESEQVLATPDEDFVVHIVRGSRKQDIYEEIPSDKQRRDPLYRSFGTTGPDMTKDRKSKA